MKYPHVARNPEGGTYILVGPNMTEDGRTVYGFKWSAVMRLASKWWAKKGRLEMTRLHGEFRDQDVGINSGLTLARDWEQLTGEERVKVCHVFEEHTLRKRDDVRESILQYMIENNPETLNQAELGKYLASLPDAEQRAQALINGGMK